MSGDADLRISPRLLAARGATYAEFRAETVANAKAAAEAARAKQLDSKSADAELRGLAESLVEMSNSIPTDDAIYRVRLANEQFKRDLLEVQPAYELDINDSRRIGAMQGFELKTLRTFAFALYGEFGICAIEHAYPGSNALRRFFEDYSGDQCQGAIGKTKPFIPGTTPCWICGFTIPIVYPPSRGTPPHGLSMECEHVFPIAQAIFFIDLYRGVKTPEAVVDMVQVEYDWSHRLCNQIKSDTHFLQIDPANRAWKLVDDSVIKKFIEQIYTRSHTYLPPGESETFRDIVNRFPGGPAGWRDSRLEVIKKRVTDVLRAGFGGFAPGIFTILSAASAIDRFDKQIEPTNKDVLLNLLGRPRGRGARRNLRKIFGRSKKRQQTRRGNKHRKNGYSRRR